MTINIQRIEVLIEKSKGKIEPQPYSEKSNSELTVFERCMQIEWRCKHASNIDIPRGKVAPLVQFFYEKKIYTSSLFFFFVYHDFCNQKETRNILALRNEIESFLTNEEYEAVVEDEKKFIASSKIPAKYYTEFANSIVYRSSLFSTLN